MNGETDKYEQAVDALGDDMAEDAGIEECAFCGAEDPEGKKWVRCKACKDFFCSQDCVDSHLTPGVFPQCGGSDE